MNILLLVVSSLFGLWYGSAASSTCERVTVEECVSAVGYNLTIAANSVDHPSQDEAAAIFKKLYPVFKSDCSDHLLLFACTAYVPICEEGKDPIGPCRSLCLKVRGECEPTMKEMGYNWPDDFECSKFQRVTDENHLCILQAADEAE